MTAEERFKMFQSGAKIQGTGALIRHHNPAYEGIANAGFLQDERVQLNHRQFQHMFNNGHARKIEPISDTETERSLGEVVIPMTTFGKSSSKIGPLILNASQLQ